MSNFISQVNKSEEDALEIITKAKKMAKDNIETAKEEALSENEKIKEQAILDAKERLSETKEEAKKVYSKALNAFGPELQKLDVSADLVSRVVDKCTETVMKKIV